jgi:UDPglucose 6-dehydrogenase
VLPSLLALEIDKLIGGICYSPFFVALGSAIKYFENPGYLPIGTNNQKVAETVRDFYLAINEKTKFFLTSFENVEVMKYSINLALINKISLLNTLTEYCEKYGAKIDDVVSAWKEDPRLAGTKMFKGGLGFGGTCFPLDARAFKTSQANKNLDTCLVDSIMKVNEHQIERMVELLEKLPERTVSILGITYKENTKVVVESQALEIANRLRSKKNVTVYDPAGMEKARYAESQYLDPGSGTIPIGRIVYASTLDEAIKASEILVFAVEWEEFKTAKIDFEGKIVVDPWRMFKDRKIKRWIPFGQN